MKRAVAPVVNPPLTGISGRILGFFWPSSQPRFAKNGGRAGQDDDDLPPPVRRGGWSWQKNLSQKTIFPASEKIRGKIGNQKTKMTVIEGQPDATAAGALLLSVESVARTCGISRRTVYRWLHEGLPSYNIPGAGFRPILRISTDDLTAWLNRFRHDPIRQAEEPKTLHLEGRRFFRPAPDFARRPELDTRSVPRSRPARRSNERDEP